jgi:predicted ribonuclease YlaK
MTQERHVNRKGKRNKTKVVDDRWAKKGDRHDQRSQQGSELIASERAVNNEDYRLDWFKPTPLQQDIVYSMHEDDLILVKGSSGTGKSTTAIWNGLRELKKGNYKKILFVKNPNESGDDQIGYLSGNQTDKLVAHMEASKGVFLQFMSEAKLEMEIKRGRIEFKIPNFIQGSTHDDTLFILEESQNFSPQTLKLVMERAGKNSKIVVLGDDRQCYSAKKREDGFTFFCKLVTEVDDEGRYSKIDTIGYVELPVSENMRSALSRLVVTLFEENTQ